MEKYTIRKNENLIVVSNKCIICISGGRGYLIQVLEVREVEMKIGAYQFAVTSDMKHNMEIIENAVRRASGEKVKLLVFKYFNSAITFSPDCENIVYHKRALWGWDKENFCVGNKSGIFQIDGIKIGIRICFEVRFPEFFRELYKEGTDQNIILFYDVSNKEDFERYELIKSHIRTRAVENVCYTLTVNTIRPYQTAPTALFDRI